MKKESLGEIGKSGNEATVGEWCGLEGLLERVDVVVGFFGSFFSVLRRKKKPCWEFKVAKKREESEKVKGNEMIGK